MAKKMKAVVKTAREPDGTELKEVDIPKPGPNDVLIRVKRSSICGTDVHIFDWNDWAAQRIKPPVIYGHEFAGDVVKVGDNVDFIDGGEFVSGECHIACGHCYQCQTGNAHICENVEIFGVDRDGIFAEYACIPASNVWKNDPSLSADICSIQDPLGNAVHTIFSTDVVGKDIAILGVGPIGMMATSVCKNIGAKRVFAIGRRNEFRVNMGKELGADYGFLSAKEDVVKEIMDLTDGQGVDVVLEMAGSPNAVLTGLDVLKPGGTISLLGVYSRPLTVDLSEQVVFKYATIKGINGRRMFETWHRMAGLLKNQKIREELKKIITHRYKFDEFHDAMEMMKSGDSGKVVLEMD